jgi:hypothetical protein
MSEEKLEKQFEVYRELAKKDKKIDIAALMIDALQSHQNNLLDAKQKRWAYLVSLVAPPFGLLFAMKFYTAGKDDSKEAALACVVLTAVSILLGILFFKAVFSGAGTSLNQIQQIKPDDIQQLLQ